MKIYLLFVILALFNLSCAQSLRGKGRELVSIELSGVSGTANLTNSSTINNTQSGDNADIPVATLSNNNSSVPEGWESIDVEEFKNDAVLMEAHYSALLYVNELGTQATVFPGQVTGSDILKVFRQVSNDINYKIDSYLTVENGTDINVSTLFYFDAETNSREILNFTLAYKYIDEDLIVNNATISWNNGTGNFTIDLVPDSNLNWGDQDSSYMTPRHYDISLDGFLALGGYSTIQVDQVNTDQLLSNYLLYGLQQTVAAGIEYQYLVSQPSYNLVQIYSIYGQQSNDGSVQWYRCEVGIDNGAGSTAVVSYEVYVESSIQSIQVPTFGFLIVKNTSSSN